MNDDDQQPYRPPLRRTNHYAAINNAKQEITTRKDLFSMTITATSEKGESMKEQQLLIDLVFKPIEPGLKLRPEETQLLLAYLGEILKEIEDEVTLMEKKE